MTTVAITGAAGEVGREAVRAFDDHPTTSFTHRPREDIESTVLDVTDRDAFVDALGDEEVLVHLAWGPAGRTGWTDGHEANLRGTVHAYEAARANDLQRVVFASSVHATGMYNRDEPGEMESLSTDASTAVHPADPPRPDSYYGVAKVASESMGSFYADRYGLEVVSLRLGWLQTHEELRAMRSAPDARVRFARATWLSPRDCRGLLRAAALEPLPSNPVTLHGVSRNADRFHSLTETALAVGYRPRDDAAEVLDGG